MLHVAENLPTQSWRIWHQQLADKTYVSTTVPPVEALQLASVKEFGDGKFGASIRTALAARGEGQSIAQPMSRHRLLGDEPPSASASAVQTLGPVPPPNYRVFVTPDQADARLEGQSKILVTPPGDANVAYLKRLIGVEINFHESDLMLKMDEAVVTDSATLRSLVSSVAAAAHNNRLDVSVTTNPREIKIATTDHRSGRESLNTLVFSRARQITYGDIRDSLAGELKIGAAKIVLTTDGFSVASASMDSMVDFSIREVIGASVTAA